MKRRLRNCGLGWMGAALLCWWFYSKNQPQQIAAAGIIAAAVITLLDPVARYSGISHGIQWAWLRPFLSRLPRQLIIGIVQVLAVFFRSSATGAHPIGSYREAAFFTGKSRITAGRRALILMAVSITPNTFAVSFQDENRLLFHQLAPGSRSPAEEWGL